MKHNTGTTDNPPKWCDLRCGSADFAKVDGLDGSCHTFQSLWCEKLKTHVTKNSPCQAVYGRRGVNGGTGAAYLIK